MKPDSFIYEDGEWYYIGASDGAKRKFEHYHKKNTSRMFVGGKYIPKTHPMHKPGHYKTFEDAWNHSQLNKQTKGHVYAIVNPAWPGWIKVGKAVDAQDRTNSYQTGSPLRDYELLAYSESEDKNEDEKKAHRLFEKEASERKGEWFKLSNERAYTIIQDLADLQDPLPSPRRLRIV